MELIATEGHWLTQANLNDEADRCFWKKAHLAYSLTAADSSEWTDAQKAEWETANRTEDDELD